MHLNVSSVSVRLGSRVLFENITLRLNPGQMVAVVGPSGSGKSTLLAIASGLTMPTQGHVSTIADDGSDIGSPLHHCSWVPQGSNQLSARSVLDNAMIGGLGRGLSRHGARRLAEEALHRVGLLGLVAHQSSMLSGGEIQRLAIARAMCLGRPFLFADEPTGQLDALNTQVVFDLMRSASDDGLGVVIATHDLSIADACDALVEL